MQLLAVRIYFKEFFESLILAIRKDTHRTDRRWIKINRTFEASAILFGQMASSWKTETDKST